MRSRIAVPTTPMPPSRRVIYRGRKIDLALQPVTLADGSIAEREVVRAPRRGGPGAHGRPRPRLPGQESSRRHRSRRSLEVPAGTIDEGESPDQTAERELAEETGFRAGRITPVCDWYVSPGVMTERMFLYLCEDLDSRPDRSSG